MDNRTKNLTKGNPTGALSKAKLIQMKAMADFGERVQKKICHALRNALNDPDKCLKACEIILKYTCPIPKDTSDEVKENPLNAHLLEMVVKLQEENRALTKALSEKNGNVNSYDLSHECQQISQTILN